MLIESVDGEHALLGRPRSLKRRGGILTCLSGFIEQGESIEEAVRYSHTLTSCRWHLLCTSIRSATLSAKAISF